MKLLDGLPANTRNCLMVEPLWALFGGVVFYFAPLYMADLGLTDIEMGIVNSVGLFASFVFFTLAGPVTNKYGRRRTSLVFDILSWSVSMVIWTFAQNFVWFVVAVIFNSAVRVVTVSWNLLLTEDAPQDRVVKVYAIVNIIGSMGGFVTLAAGLLLDHFGVIPVMRWTYGLGAVFMTAMFFLRNALCTETANGRILMEQNRNVSLWNLIFSQLRNFRTASRDGHFFFLAIAFLISTAVGSFNFYQIIHLTDNLGYSKSQLSIVPAVNSLVSILLVLVVLPRIPKTAERSGLLAGFLLCAATATAFLFLGKDMLPLVLLVQGLASAGFLVLLTYLNSVFMNSVREAHKAELFGLVQMLSMLLSIPTGYLAGLMFSLNPLSAFGVSIGLFAAGGLVCLSLLKRHRVAAL